MTQKGRFSENFPVDSSSFFLVSMENVTDLLKKLRGKLKSLYYRAVLFAKPCPNCKAPDLIMLKDSWCKCQSCSHEFDPTVEFQVCSTCRTSLKRRIFHYWCEKCRKRVKSAYCFDAKVFDAVYFREMMNESRQRKKQKHEQIKQMLAESRSARLFSTQEPSLANLPGWEPELNKFVNTAIPEEFLHNIPTQPLFEMDIYRQHILELVPGCVVHFEGISNIIEDQKLDRVFRFITAVFMQHDGEIILEQNHDGRIMIFENESHRKGQAVY